MLLGRLAGISQQTPNFEIIWNQLRGEAYIERVCEEAPKSSHDERFSGRDGGLCLDGFFGA